MEEGQLLCRFLHQSQSFRLRQSAQSAFRRHPESWNHFASAGQKILSPLEDDADRQMLLNAVNSLGDREKSIITLRFGLGGGSEYTQKEVADMLGISQSYISRLEKRIIHRLKREIIRQLQ